MKSNKKREELKVRLNTTLDAIANVDAMIVSSKKIHAEDVTRQFYYMKSKMVKELVEILAEYGLVVELKEALLKEAA